MCRCSAERADCAPWDFFSRRVAGWAGGDAWLTDGIVLVGLKSFGFGLDGRMVREGGGGGGLYFVGGERRGVGCGARLRDVLEERMRVEEDAMG